MSHCLVESCMASVQLFGWRVYMMLSYYRLMNKLCHTALYNWLFELMFLRLAT